MTAKTRSKPRPQSERSKAIQDEINQEVEEIKRHGNGAIGRGQPTLYRPEYCNMLIAHFERGYSLESFAKIARVTRDTLYKWQQQNPDFLYASRLGNDLALFFYEKLGIDGITGRFERFNATAWMFLMKNRFGWRDSMDMNVNVDITSAIETAKQRVFALSPHHEPAQVIDVNEPIQTECEPVIVDKPVSEPS